MMIIYPLISILLIQSTLAFLEDSYHENFDSNAYPDDLLDADNDIEVQRRSNHFLRFGRNNNRLDNNEVIHDDYEDFARPTRSGRPEKNDHFIRFGRGRNEDFLRFGRDPQKRERSNFLRFGRSTTNDEATKKRSKREVFSDDSPKRSDAFLRFGRNSNFMRFGRDQNPNLLTSANVNLNGLSTLELLKLQEQTLATLLAQMLIRKKEEIKPCARAA